MAESDMDGEVPEYNGDLPSDPLQALAEIVDSFNHMALGAEIASRELGDKMAYFTANVRTIQEALEPRYRAFREIERAITVSRNIQRRVRRQSDTTLNLDWNVKDYGVAEPPC